MNHSQRMKNSAVGLLVVVLAILAFVRGDIQIWLLAGAFVVWALWVFVPMAVFAYKRKQLRQTRRKKAEQVVPKREVYDYEAEQAEGVLLHHVSHRITAYLRSAYPGMTWDWCEKDPERIIRSGGSARIQLYGVPDFNYATVIFDTKANINCDMMRIVPLVEVQPGAGPKPAVEKKQEVPDPQVWYEMKGRAVFENLIADLNSRGYNSLTIRENGDICIQQADNEVVKQSLKNFPCRGSWQQLVKVFERESIAATVTEEGVVLSW